MASIFLGLNVLNLYQELLFEELWINVPERHAIHWHTGDTSTLSTFGYDVCNCTLLPENFCIFMQIPLKFISEGPFNNKPSLVQVLAWHWAGEKSYPNEWWPSSLTQICPHNWGHTHLGWHQNKWLHNCIYDICCSFRSLGSFIGPLSFYYTIPKQLFKGR